MSFEKQVDNNQQLWDLLLRAIQIHFRAFDQNLFKFISSF